MLITFSCRCGRQITAPEQAAGLRIHCPGCGVALPVPSAPDRRPDPTDSPTWLLLRSRAQAQASRLPSSSSGIHPAIPGR